MLALEWQIVTKGAKPQQFGKLVVPAPLRKTDAKKQIFLLDLPQVLETD